MPGSMRTDFDVPATMRDGVILRANIFRPADDGQYPVLVARTPYGKDFLSVSPYMDAVRMARAGYIVALDDAAQRAARQTILHDTAHPSRLILPVIPG